jgi:uncharacterized protein YbbC (DUF1343 family)
MVGTLPALPWKKLCLPFIALSALFGCSATSSAPADGPKAAAPTFTIAQPEPPKPAGPVMLGIDVLESQGFAALRGKNVGLLTHPAGVNRNGVSTVDVLRRAPGVKLLALFAPEHGIYGDIPAGDKVTDRKDPRTGLTIYSLYGTTTGPTKAQLAGIDVFVIDLQDIGVRSYTFTVCMKYAIEGCFRNGTEVMVLDRPNPLGGLKVDGPILDAELKSGVGGYRIPYVHGLTIGEIARMAAQAPGVLDMPEATRARGKLTVVPMRGWNRAMRWPETGLKFVPTSPYVQDFAAVVGYAMVGLGSSWGNFVKPGFSHGIGPDYPFRGLGFPGRTADLLIQDLQALKIPGLGFRKLTVTGRDGKPATGVYVDVLDWEAWRPTELSFQLLRLNCRLAGTNPFANLAPANARSLNIHVGSMEWYNALKRDGAKVDVEGFIKTWQARNAIYQQQSKRYWLYN